MAPIRVAFIGLSATRSWADTAHWPYLRQSPKYEIVGICNSSKQSSETAIASYGLDSAQVKAYGSPQELADDADAYDLAVCSVRIDRHYDAIMPVIAAGKQCYVEWPLGKTLDEAADLLAVAKALADSPKTIVGSQGRCSPVIVKVKELVSRGTIGRVLSVRIHAAGGNMGAIDVAEMVGSINTMNDSSVQATMLTIHFGHLMDSVLYALDDTLSNVSGVTSTQRPTALLAHGDGRTEKVKRETPDHVAMHGHLGHGGVISMHIRGGPAFKDSPGCSWYIYGEKGEIEISSPTSAFQVFTQGAVIKLHDHAKDTLETVDWSVGDEFESLPFAAQNVARLYEAFADGKTDVYADWEAAVQRQRIIRAVAESSSTGKTVSLQ